MAGDSQRPPKIAISRTSSINHEDVIGSSRGVRPSPRKSAINASNHQPWQRSSKSWGHHKTGLEWHIKWTDDCFRSGRVLIVDYISNQASVSTPASEKRHVTVAAQEFDSLKGLHGFYANNDRVHGAALRVIHVQNATWATRFLLRKFNIDHPSEIVGMQGFSKWARYEKPRQRNGRPFPNGRSWREQTDPWRNVSRTAFGLDYLKAFNTRPPNQRNRRSAFGDKPIDAQMMHLDSYSDGRSPHGYDVSVQRMSVYIQRNLGPPDHVSPEEVRVT